MKTISLTLVIYDDDLDDDEVERVRDLVVDAGKDALYSEYRHRDIDLYSED